MSILVRGMKMPETCSDCELYQYGFCMVTENDCDKAWTQRQDDCPLIEVQSPHGDLVDRNYLITEYDRHHHGPAGGARRIIEDAPTIIGAEGSKE